VRRHEPADLRAADAYDLVLPGTRGGSA
jgi:hypothetical protein